mmetsp:Transcript_18266/g.62035  ORF Transcript_18266/g.62035 Transcript_18266/m.62035 type:complete len:231 (+) Transcript_18266:1290-1982(+)
MAHLRSLSALVAHGEQRPLQRVKPFAYLPKSPRDLRVQRQLAKRHAGEAALNHVVLRLVRPRVEARVPHLEVRRLGLVQRVRPDLHVRRGERPQRLHRDPHCERRVELLPWLKRPVEGPRRSRDLEVDAAQPGLQLVGLAGSPRQAQLLIHHIRLRLELRSWAPPPLTGRFRGGCHGARHVPAGCRVSQLAQLAVAVFGHGGGASQSLSPPPCTPLHPSDSELRTRGQQA